ncbi:290565d5-407b-4ee8-b4bb-cc992fbc1943 [Sclerotinia trifoliorum]|uniref:290565d5-407b-4ee8-b4bb-cc992fbc1943 n=1 Tax=Sclerotinia trifoliorum TaxID=28548 RepID=A0A8H2VM13_9HELO|nr:290565d5-407b-4ee8-b4bb-cc992fbc1943 [Sclerotinia trifoliorum]
MPPKVIFFAGAPSCDSLDWDESNLLTDFTEPFIQFLHLPQSYPNSAPRNNTSILESSTPSNFGPDWRELPLDRKHLATGVSQDHAFHEHGAAGHALDFFSTTTFLSQSQGDSQSPSLNYDTYLSTNDENENYDQEPIDHEIISHFYEHSYAIHDIPSSQIAPHDSFISSNSDDAGTSFSTSNSLYDSQSIFPQSGEENLQIPVAAHVTNLKDMPHAQYLSSIHPQTMTVNLIVGIISISEPRAIATRKGGEVSLVEILVGDETKSGFSINFWLSGKGKEDVKEILGNLRVQDIVLMKHVALGSFRGKVHGQSLRRDLTKVWLMYREKIDRSDMGGCYGKRDLEGKEIDVQLGKVRRVRDWVVRFVGVAAASRGLRGVKRVREELPPDTQ